MTEEITRIEGTEEVTAETTTEEKSCGITLDTEEKSCGITLDTEEEKSCGITRVVEEEEKQYKMLTTREKLDSEIERMNDEFEMQVTDTAKALLKDYNRELLIAKYLEWAKTDEPIKTALTELYATKYSIKHDSDTDTFTLAFKSVAVDILDFIGELQSRTDYKKLVAHIPSKNLLRERSENLCIAIALRMSAKTAKDDAHKAKKADEIINYYKRSKSNTTTAQKLESLSKSKFDTELESWFKDILPKFKDEDGNEHNVFLTRSDKAFIENAFTSIDKNAEHSIAFVKPDTLRAIFVKVLHRIVINGYYGDTFKRADSSYYQATVKTETAEPTKTETAEPTKTETAEPTKTETAEPAKTEPAA